MATIIVRPSKVPQGIHAKQKLFVTLASANWDGSTVFTVSGVTGVSKVGQSVHNATQAHVYITTTTAAKSTQTLTVSDGTNSGTTSVTRIAPARYKWFRPLYNEPT